VDLLLILYAMIAGLTGFNAGPSAIARMPDVAQGQVIASQIGALAPQAAVAVKAFASRAAFAVAHPPAPLADSRLLAISATVVDLPVIRRQAPERRLE
jgi:hypothetical protein